LINRNYFVIFLAGYLFSLVLSPNFVVAQQPNPPILCIADSADCENGRSQPNGTIKWHPGHYVKTQGQHCSTDQEGYFAGIQRNLDAYIPSSDNFLGAYVIYGWGALETDKGVYDWSRVYDNLNWLASRGKHLLVAVEHKCYGRMTNPEWVVPKNLESEVEPQKAGVIGALWRENVMDQYIDFVRAFAAEFDDLPNVEMVSFIPESCPGFGSAGSPADFSTSGYSAQIQRMYDAAAVAFRQTIFAGGVNCPMSGEAVNLIEALYQNGQGRADPDAHAVDGYKVFKGEEGAVRDYRGLIPHRVIVSAPNLGGFSDILPLSNIQSLLSDGSVTHVAWVLSSKAPGGTKADIISHIETPAIDNFEKCPSRLEVLLGGCQ